MFTTNIHDINDRREELHKQAAEYRLARSLKKSNSRTKRGLKPDGLGWFFEEMDLSWLFTSLQTAPHGQAQCVIQFERIV